MNEITKHIMFNYSPYFFHCFENFCKKIIYFTGKFFTCQSLHENIHTIVCFLRKISQSVKNKNVSKIRIEIVTMRC